MELLVLFLACALVIGCGRADKPAPDPDKKSIEVAPAPRLAG